MNKFVITALLFCVLLFVANYIFQADPWLETIEPNKVIEIDNLSVVNEGYKSIDLNNKEVIFYFLLSDFTCTSCSKNFLHYTDNISDNIEKWNNQTLFVTKRSNISLAEQEKKIINWAKANYFNEEIDIFISEDFDGKYSIEKSAILVSSGGDDYKVFYLPLKPSERKYIDSKLGI